MGSATVKFLSATGFALLGLVGSTGAGLGQTLTTLHAFTGNGYPVAGLTYLAGALYGTTSRGGANDGGRVFKVQVRSGHYSLLTSLPKFTYPITGLTYDNGLLYGGAEGADHGGLFSIDPTTGFETKFNVVEKDPHTLLLQNSRLYGTTGPNYGKIFRFDPVTGRSAELHRLNHNGKEGEVPSAGLTAGSNDTLYGTTLHSGPYCRKPMFRCGTIFSIAPDTGKFAVIYGFTDGADGGEPNGLLYQDGYLYGTAESGGFNYNGVVFKFDIATSTETVLYKFSGNDGSGPMGGLIFQGGYLYGTTYAGGTANFGTIFKIDPASGVETTLYSFHGEGDGAYPMASLLYQDGAFYGTTSAGGVNAECCGTVFKFQP
jgi:uncharacterized repeat protein (TIGR03803 family)